jgi:DNA polymerase elongation subunit (family B)
MRLFNKLNVSAAKSGDEKQFAGLAAVAASVLDEADAKKKIELGRLGGPTTWGIWAEGAAELEGDEERIKALELAAKETDEERYRSMLPAKWLELRDYNVDDSEKMQKIEARTGYVDLLTALCQSTYTLPDSRGMLPTKYVEGFLLRLGKARGMRFPSRVWEDEKPGDEAEEEEQFKGAYCLEPTQLGIIRDVHVCDFARLYPSIIRSWNMSPETWRSDVEIEPRWWENRPSYLLHVPRPPDNPLPAGHCVAALTKQVFANEPKGILAEALDEMLRLRKFWGDKKKRETPGTDAWKEADRRDTAYKNISNGFYGVVGSKHSRFFVREVAESCAQTGVWLIQETIKVIEARGWKVLYCDTDSAFVLGCTEEEFTDFVETCDREVYPKLLESKGCARNFISLAYEKAFDVLVMVGKKRYAARYLHYKCERATADSEPEIKGLEFKRGDSARIARRMQEETIAAMLSGNDDPAFYEDLVMRYRTRILEEELEREDVVLSKRLTKPLREYVRTKKKDGAWARQSPHIEVARVLERKGRDVGGGVRIEYIVIDDSTDPPVYESGEEWTPGMKFDRFYLWESMVFPPTQRVLEKVFKVVDWRKYEKARPPKSRAPQGAGDLFDAKGNPKHRDVKATGAKREPSPKKLVDKLIAKVDRETREEADKKKSWQRSLFDD